MNSIKTLKNATCFSQIVTFLVVVVSLSLALSACGETPSAPVPTNTTIGVAATTTTTTNAAIAVPTLASTQIVVQVPTTNLATTAVTPSSTTAASTQTSTATTTTQSGTATAIPTSTPKPTPIVNADGFAPHSFNHVFLIVLENTDYQQALANPYLGQLAKSGVLLTNFYAVTHPSYPNYMALAGGSTFGISSDGQEDIDKTNLVDLMEPAGVSWKVYAEGLPTSQKCYTGVQSGRYVRKHEPFASFLDVQKNPARCAKIVNSEQLKTDVAANQLPQYSLYVPDLNDDGHDTGVNYSADWLKNFLPTVMQNPKFTDGTLVIITFDEGKSGGSNQIYTLLLGPTVKTASVSNNRYDHYSILRTIEDNFGLGNLGREDAKAHDIVGVWNTK